MKASPLPPAIKGWCPSALNPMETGDGLLVRLRLAGGELTAQICAELGKLAETYGNGLIDLSQRGNLQLRGVTLEALPALTLAMHTLGVLEGSAQNGTISQVIGPPLAGIDTSGWCDGKALVRELETKLIAATDLHNLPPKFCFLVDDGGRLGFDTVPADIKLISHDGQIVLAVASSQDDYSPVVVADVSHAADAALALARAFLALCEATSARRMYQLVQGRGVKAIVQAAGLAPDLPLPAIARRITSTDNVIGRHEGFIGAAGPFGRFNAAQMHALAACAPEGLRLTPWRAILLPDAKPEALQTLEGAGLIVSPCDPRLAIVACPGQPACSSAQIDTRIAAQELSSFVRRLSPNGIALHISGCSKGCAHAASTPITLVGREAAYDLIFDGRVDAEPTSRGLDLSRVLTAIGERQAGRIYP
jgi:precorrin-3B synthase